MSSAAAEKAPTSLSSCKPTGVPNLRRAACSPHHARFGRQGSDGAVLQVSTYQVSATKVTTRLINVAHPAPANPRAGAPRFPKMNTQLRNTLSKTPPNMIQNAGQGRDWLSK